MGLRDKEFCAILRLPRFLLDCVYVIVRLMRSVKTRISFCVLHDSVTDPRDIPLLCKSDQPNRDDPRAVRAAKDFQNVSILRNTKY